MNKITITGYLGRAPEGRYTPTGTMVSRFSVASTRKYTGNDGEKVSDTVWFNVSAWGRLGEIAMEYLGKGSHVLVEGRIQEPYVWKGGEKASNQITATSLEILSWKDRVYDPEDAQAPVEEDGIPF
jgi:single-strand DNA-binding protein